MRGPGEVALAPVAIVERYGRDQRGGVAGYQRQLIVNGARRRSSPLYFVYPDHSNARASASTAHRHWTVSSCLISNRRLPQVHI